jgi:hypothetical protein
MCYDEEAVQDAKSECRHGKEVHRCDGFAMVAQECRPSLCRLGIPLRFPHPAQHGSLGEVEAEHFQLAVNPWRTPSGVFCDHAKDEFAQFPTDTFSPSAAPMPREPGPIQFEPSPMPADDRLRLDDEERMFPSRPESKEANPKQPIWDGKPRMRMPTCQNGKLLA